MHHWNRFLRIGLVLASAILFSGSFGFAALTEEEFAKAKALHELKCAKCHKLYDPNAYDGPTWNGWMEKMKKKARLKDEQYRLLLNYFETVRSGKTLDK